jgi:large repetitive protein
MSRIKPISILIILCFCSFTLSIAQSFMQPWNAATTINYQFAQQNNTFNQGLQQHIQNIGKLSNTTNANKFAPILKIPIVVHIVHDPNDLVGTATNLSVDQIQSQIHKLNQAFRKNDPNFANTPAVFQNLAADAEIEFCLANIAPNGTPTNGIVRHSLPTTSINSINYIETVIKPSTQWNPANYLNIWTIAVPNTNIFGGVQGYAYTPVAGFAGVSPLDGVVVDYRFFGVGHNAIGQGVVAVREVARYLGLLDIWGLNGANGLPVGCASDDGLADTPSQEAPTGIKHPTCPSSIPISCGTQDMYPNYMDYMRTQSCQTMFTAHQVNVMRAILNGQAGTIGLGNRSSLTANSLTACNASCNISLTTFSIPSSCGGAMTGVASANAAGGAAPYTFAWSTGQTGNLITGLAVGTYAVTVTDANACQQTKQVTIGSASTISATATIVHESCNGKDGAITLNPTGGTAPYNVTWLTMPMQFGNTISNLEDSFYVYSIVDALGCTYSDYARVINHCPQICDTILYVPNLLQVAASLYINPFNGGFLTGSSPYKDLAMANYTNYQGIHTHVIGVEIGLGYVGNSSNSSVEFVVWDGTGGVPGSELGSHSVDMPTLGANVGQSFYVKFGTEVMVGNEFFVGYKIPTAAGDTIAFASSSIGDGVKGSNVAWTQYSDGTWHSFLNDWQEDMGVAILPVMGTPPQAIFSPTNVTACATNAQVTFTNSSTNASDFTWTLAGANTVSPVAFSPTVHYSTVGTYNAELIVHNSCVSDTMFVPNAVTVNNCPVNCNLYAVLTQTNLSCGNNGTATVAPSAGTAPYNVVWSTNQTSNTIANLSTGIYTVTVTDATGCAVVGSINVSSPTPPLNIVVNGTNETCAQNDGTVNVVAIGGTAPYTYVWNTTATADSLIGLAAGTYSVTVTDANNCSLSNAVIISAPPPIMVDSLISNSLLCASDSNGSAAIYVSGDTLTHTYAWSNGSIFSTAHHLSSGTYYITVTNTAGCQIQDSVTIIAPPPILVTVANLTNIKCNGDATGAITVNTTGGTGLYNYSWNNSSSTTNSAANLVAGLQTVTVTDANGCSVMDSIHLTEPNPLVIQVTTTPVSCTGGFDGTATANISGGVGNYSLFWDNFQTTPTATNLTPGTHQILVTDANGCQQITPFNILTIPPMSAASFTSQSVSCTGGNNGNASIQMSGGTPPYSYNWNTTPIQNTATAFHLSTGVYSVTVTDANGCTFFSPNISVTEPFPLIVTAIDVFNPLCHNGTDGYIQLNATGGTPNYSYTWSNGGTTSMVLNLSASTYTVVVNDANGCSKTLNFTLTEPDALIFQAATMPTSCYGSSDGEISIETVAGGIPPYTYTINNVNYFPITFDQIALQQGNYTVQVLDANGCREEQILTVAQPPLIALDLGADREIILGQMLQLGATTTLPPLLTYTWTTQDSSMSCLDCPNPTITPIASGDYTLTIMDENGCSSSDNVFVRVMKERRIFVPNIFTPNSDGQNDVLVVHGGTGVEEILQFKVFDRWGALMFSANNFPPNSTSTEHAWDGWYKGRELEPNTFVYFIEVLFSDGLTNIYEGDVFLMR